VTQRGGLYRARESLSLTPEGVRRPGPSSGNPRAHMGHTFHSEVPSPTVQVLDAAAAASLIDPDATASLVADGFGAALTTLKAIRPPGCQRHSAALPACLTD
jgi:hypothetical protein